MLSRIPPGSPDTGDQVHPAYTNMKAADQIMDGHVTCQLVVRVQWSSLTPSFLATLAHDITACSMPMALSLAPCDTRGITEGTGN